MRHHNARTDPHCSCHHLRLSPRLSRPHRRRRAHQRAWHSFLDFVYSQDLICAAFSVLTLATRLGSTTAWLPSLFAEPQVENSSFPLRSHLASAIPHGSVFLEPAGPRCGGPLTGAEAVLCTACFVEQPTVIIAAETRLALGRHRPPRRTAAFVQRCVLAPRSSRVRSRPPKTNYPQIRTVSPASYAWRRRVWKGQARPTHAMGRGGCREAD